MASVVYRFSSELESRIVENVITYGDVKQRIAEKFNFRSDRTRLVIKFDDIYEITPKDEQEVEKNRWLIVQRLPRFRDDNYRDAAKTTSIKTTGQPTPALRNDDESLKKFRRSHPRRVLDWLPIREYLQRLLKSQDFARVCWKPKENCLDPLEVLRFLRRIRSKLTRMPFEALVNYFQFRTDFAGTVYFSRYCGRQDEYLVALERIFFGLFEEDFTMSTSDDTHSHSTVCCN